MRKFFKAWEGKIGIVAIFASVVLLAIPTVAGAATTTLSPSDDSYVHEGNPTSNYGTATSLYVKNDPGLLGIRISNTVSQAFRV